MSRWLARILLALFLAPALFLSYRAFAPGGLDALYRLAGTLLPIYVGNTLLITATATLLAVAIGAGAAFLVVIFDFQGRRFLDTALVFPMVLPSYLVAILYREFSHLHAWSPAPDSLLGAALIMALTLYPYVYLLTRTSLQRQAAAYTEIGQSLGLGRGAILMRVLLPLSAPAMLLGALLVALETMSDFGTMSVLGIRTLTTAVHGAWFSIHDETLAAQLALIGTLLPLLLIAVYGLVTAGRGFENPANRPRAPRPIALPKPWCWLATLCCLLPLILGFAAPVVILLGWAADAFDKIRLSSIYGDFFNTLILALGTTAAATSIGLWLALTSRMLQKPAWTLTTLWVLTLNYAMPAMVLAIALLFLTGWSYQTTLGAWLANSLFLVLLATTLRFTALAHASAETGLKGLSLRLDETVRCTGRQRYQGITRVLLPLIRVPLSVGAFVVFVITAKELTLSLVLQPFGFSSLALSVYHFANIDLYGPAAVHALCLVILLIYPVLSLNRWMANRWIARG